MALLILWMKKNPIFSAVPFYLSTLTAALLPAFVLKEQEKVDLTFKKNVVAPNENKEFN